MFTTSFGLEDQVILHALRQHQIDVEIVTLDTGRLFPETHDVWMESEQRYGIRIRSIYPQHAAVEALVAAQGINGFFHSRDARVACCHVRKVEPLNRALAGAAAWITGLRSDQSDARRDVGLVNVDWDRGILKFNPLFDWTREAVLSFTRERRRSGQRPACQGLRLHRLRPVHARHRARRERARRPLVVGRGRQEGVRTARAPSRRAPALDIAQATS